MLLVLAVLAAVLGALIGSFANVVIYRLPNRRSIVVPGSSCPHCGHRLGPLELIPIVSWAVQGARCRACGQRISVRYPAIEALTAIGFAWIVLRWPPTLYGASALPLLAVFAMLVMLAFIDIDHQLLPDSLTLPALAVGLLGTLLYPAGSGLPSPAGAAVGAAIGAGVIVLINRLGGLALRRFRDTRERLWPISFDQVNVAALAGALGGWVVGLGAAGLSLLVNLVARRPLRAPEPALYAVWLVALAASTTAWWVGPGEAIGGSVGAAGAVAVAAALFWWLFDIVRDLGRNGADAPAPDPGVDPASVDPAADEPIAMGFGDVTLAAVLGALLGWEKLLVGLFLAFLLGAVGGVAGRLLGGDRVIPFGPYLILGALLALAFGDAVLAWYLGLLQL